MTELKSKLAQLDQKAEKFSLTGTDGKTYSLDDISGKNGTLIMFICNHCPYVLAIIDKIIRDAKELQQLELGVAAICSNDAISYPDDDFPAMKRMAIKHAFPFPYLHDEDQSVAKAYGAVCTPDFFGFNASGKLQYRGRLDESRINSQSVSHRRDLFEAMKQIAETGKGPENQIPSIGCSIKWKT